MTARLAAARTRQWENRMGIGPTEWLLLAFLVVLLFGSGKISALMGDVAKGLKAFRRGMAEDSDQASGSTP